MKEQIEKLMEEYSNKIHNYINSLEETNLQLENTIDELRKKNDVLLHKIHTNDVKEQKILTLDNGVLLSYKQLSNIINTLATAETPEAKELAEYLIRFGNKTFDKQSVQESVQNDSIQVNDEQHKKNALKNEFLPKDILDKLNENTQKNEQAINDIVNKTSENDIPVLFTQEDFQKALDEFVKANPLFNLNKHDEHKKESVKENVTKKANKESINDILKDTPFKNTKESNSNVNLWDKMNDDIRKTKENVKNKSSIKPKKQYNEDDEIKQFNDMLNKFFAGHPQDGSVLDLIDTLLNAHNHHNYNRWN